MKYVFFLALLLFTPALAALLRARPGLLRAACFVLGLSTLLMGPKLWAAPIPWPTWPGPVRGIEISYIDAFSIAFIAATSKVRVPGSLTMAFSIYLLALVVSTFEAFQWEPALFYAWQLVRAVLLFVGIARVSATDKGAPVALVAGLGSGLILEAGYVAFQYMAGIDRPGGTFGHSNFVGLALDFVVFPAAAPMQPRRHTSGALACV